MRGECTLAALSRLDREDPEAVQAMLRACLGILTDVELWAWAIGLTLACALIGAVIGHARGRWLAGLAWGAALGPIGWVIAAAMASRRRECADCGEANPPRALRCGRCGIDLAYAAKRSARSELKRAERGGNW